MRMSEQQQIGTGFFRRRNRCLIAVFHSIQMPVSHKNAFAANLQQLRSRRISKITVALDNMENLTASLAGTSRQLEKMMHNDIPQLTEKLNVIGDNFATISGDLKKIDYVAAMQKVDSTLANVKMITDKLNRKDNTIGLLFNDPTLYNNLSATTANAASLLEDLKSHPKRYVHFSLFGKKDK